MYEEIKPGLCDFANYCYNKEPVDSPWGEIQTSTMIAAGVFEVSTAGHGGMMVLPIVAKGYFTPGALKLAERHNGCYCFEEDVAGAVVMRELLDKSWFDVPENRRDYYTRESLIAACESMIEPYAPEYWKYRQNRLAKERAGTQAKTESCR